MIRERDPKDSINDRSSAFLFYSSPYNWDSDAYSPRIKTKQSIISTSFPRNINKTLSSPPNLIWYSHHFRLHLYLPSSQLEATNLSHRKVFPSKRKKKKKNHIPFQGNRKSLVQTSSNVFKRLQTISNDFKRVRFEQDRGREELAALCNERDVRVRVCMRVRMRGRTSQARRKQMVTMAGVSRLVGGPISRLGGTTINQLAARDRGGGVATILFDILTLSRRQSGGDYWYSADLRRSWPILLGFVGKGNGGWNDIFWNRLVETHDWWTRWNWSWMREFLEFFWLRNQRIRSWIFFFIIDQISFCCRSICWVEPYSII